MEKTGKIEKTNLFQKFLYCLAALAGAPYITTIGALAFINVNKADNAGDVRLLESIVTISYIVFPALIIILTLVWHVMDIKRRKSATPLANRQIIYNCICLCRYMLAAIIIFYGLDKLMVDQLKMSYYWYGDELGKLSGSQLTWSFFGYSKFYNSCIAIAQVAGGLLLLFRRTTLLGALFLLPILINITLIDYNYDISAKDIITVLLLLDIFLISISARPLISFFLANKQVNGENILSGYSPERSRSLLSKSLLVFGVLLFAIMTNFNLMPKHPEISALEGAWDAVTVTNFSDPVPEKNKKLTLRLFVDGKSATVKKTYQYQDFTLGFDSVKKDFISLTTGKDSLHKDDIIGIYKLIGKDSMVFNGKDGKDSVYWSLRKAVQKK
jgi:hypothetical protein